MPPEMTDRVDVIEGHPIDIVVDSTATLAALSADAVAQSAACSIFCRQFTLPSRAVICAGSVRWKKKLRMMKVRRTSSNRGSVIAM